LNISNSTPEKNLGKLNLRYLFERLRRRIIEHEDTYQPNGMFGSYSNQDSNKLNLKNLYKIIEEIQALQGISYVKEILFILG
jgi:hypothetical protein